MQIAPAEVDRFLSAPPATVRLVLIHGDDDGLVAERMGRIVKAVTGDSADPFAHLRLEPDVLSADPRRLADEAHAIPMFGGRRCITIRLSGNWSVLPAIEPLLADPPADAWIVVAAGELRKTAPIRRLFETSKAAAAIACYPDTARDLDRLIDEETEGAGLTITADARAALKGLIGGDRLASRGEVAKLCLYAADRGEVGLDDVRAIVGDASGFAVDEAIDAAALGNAGDFALIYRRLLAAGTADYVVAGAALRHFDFLHRARALYDHGTDAESAVGPQIFYKRKAAVARQIALWPLNRIERALGILNLAVRDSRLKSAISDDVVGQAMLMVAALAPVKAR